jgi:hypothetical protein
VITAIRPSRMRALTASPDRPRRVLPTTSPIWRLLHARRLQRWRSRAIGRRDQQPARTSARPRSRSGATWEGRSSSTVVTTAWRFRLVRLGPALPRRAPHVRKQRDPSCMDPNVHLRARSSPEAAEEPEPRDVRHRVTGTVAALGC